MTQNALTPITSNTLAKAEDVMGNFEYLDGKITQYVAVIEDKADADTVSSQINTLNTSVSNISSGLNNYVEKDDVKNKGSATKPVYFNSSGIAQECTGLDSSFFGNNIGVITEKYSNGTSWYRVWSDGWIEQGGFDASATLRNTSYQITLLKSFSDTNYNIIVTPKHVGGTGAAKSWGVNNAAAVATDKFYIISNAYGDVTTGGVYWQACGY